MTGWILANLLVTGNLIYILKTGEITDALH